MWCRSPTHRALVSSGLRLWPIALRPFYSRTATTRAFRPRSTAPTHAPTWWLRRLRQSPSPPDGILLASAMCRTLITRSCLHWRQSHWPHWRLDLVSPAGGCDLATTERRDKPNGFDPPRTRDVDSSGARDLFRPGASVRRQRHPDRGHGAGRRPRYRHAFGSLAPPRTARLWCGFHGHHAPFLPGSGFELVGPGHGSDGEPRPGRK